MGAHEVVDGSHLGGQRAPDAGLARDWKRPAVRLARARRRHRGDTVVCVGGNRQGATRVPPGGAATKGGACADIRTACGLGPIVILVVGILQVVVIVYAVAPLLVLATVVFFFVVSLSARTTRLVGLGTLVARTDRGRTVEFVPRALLERGHRNGPKPAL